MKSSFIILLLVLQFFGLASLGNDQVVSFQRLNSNAGLSSDDVTDILQDSEGYIWMTTTNGINRFDGYTVVNYGPDFTKDNTFNTTNFRCLEEDKDHRIWFGSYNFGVNIYDKQSGEVIWLNESGPEGKRILDNHINNIHCDSRGRVWIATSGGLNMYDPVLDKLFAMDILDSVVYITRIFENSKNEIIVGSWGEGLFIFNESRGDFSRILFVDEALPDEPLNRIWSILEDQKGNYWIGTWEAGLHHIRIHADHSWERIREVDGLVSPIIYSLFEGSSGEIYIGTPYGLHILSEPNTDHPHVQLITAGKESTMLAKNAITAIMEDRSGVIWLASQGGGVHRIEPSVNRFTTYTLPITDEPAVRSFLTCNDGTLLIGGNGFGFGRYELQTGAFTPYSDLPAFRNVPAELNGAVCLRVDQSGNFWIGSRYWGVYVVDPETHSCRNYLRFGPPGGDMRRQVNDIFEDRFQHIWVGNENGLYQFIPEKETKGFLIFNLFDSEAFPASLKGSIINAIHEDSDGFLWVGTEGNGLFRFYNDGGASPQSIDHYTFQKGMDGGLESNFIYALVEDRQGRMWIGTGTAGLAYYQKNEDSFHHILKEHGLSGDVVLDILEVGPSLYLATNKGLTSFTWNGFRSSQYETFNHEDGLQGDLFIKGAAHCDKNGVLYLGGYNGFNVISPDQLAPNSYIPPLVFTKILVGGEQFSPYQLTEGEHVFSFNQNNIEFEFSALSFDQPQKNTYSYILEGFENQWHKVGPERRLASYTNLPAGHYMFKLLASNNSRVWNNEPIVFPFQIRAHPARSWWAICLYILGIAGILTLIFTFQLRNIRMKQAISLERIERRKEENINQFKFRFFTNISHELLTPLSVISTSVEDLAREKLMKGGQIKVLQRNTKRLMHLLSQLLDFRKVESNTMKLQVTKGDVNEFLHQISDNLSPLAVDKSIRVSLEGHVDQMVYFDHDKLDKIISNLLSNALRHTPTDGTIYISYYLSGEEDNQRLDIRVTDSGKGIEPDMLPHIFNRFYQVESVTGRTFGAGIGLALARNLAEIHKGSIEVANDDRLGATFTVTLPVAERNFKEEEKGEGDTVFRSKNYLIDLEDSRIVEYDHFEPSSKYPLQEWEKILVVEDNADFRQILTNHLSNYYQTLEACDGEEGYRSCLDKQPSLIVTDMMMPKMDGIELCRKIKNNLETSHIIVIMLTARTDEQTRFESYKVSADSYITKPVDLRTLQVRINSLLKQRRNLIDKYNSGEIPVPANGQFSELDEQFIQKTQQIIEDNLSNSELNVSALTRELGLSNSMLYRKITSLTGKAPVEYIRYIRLQNAATMLKQEDVNVSEAAYANGFNDLSYFSKCFKKQFGVSPKHYHTAIKQSAVR